MKSVHGSMASRSIVFMVGDLAFSHPTYNDVPSTIRTRGRPASKPPTKRSGNETMDDIQDEKKKVMKKVKKSAHALRHASAGVREDADIVTAAVARDGTAMEHAILSGILRGNRKVALAAVQNDGRALEHVAPMLRGDREVATAALKLGVPVKWIEDRREHFLTTNTQRDSWWELEIAATSQGKVEGVRGRLITDTGAYVAYGVRLPATMMTPFPGPYKVQALDLTQNVVFTNTVSNSPVRGAGRPNAAYAMERVMATVARGLDIDPAEIRRRNFVEKEDFPYETGLIHFDGRAMTYDSGDFHALLEKALKLADYGSFEDRKAAARREGRFLGIGISSCIEDTGSGPYEGVTIRVDPRGQVHVASGAASQGQGHHTILKQIVADELRIDIGDIHVEIGDTSKFPQGVGTTGSRVGVNIGTAAFVAASDVRRKAIALAADILDTDVDALELEEGLVRDKNHGNLTISLGELALRLAPMAGGAIPEGHGASLEATSYQASEGQPHASGSNVCEVKWISRLGMSK